jgi:hypothetical protein
VYVVVVVDTPIPGDTGQNDVVKRRSDELDATVGLLESDEEIHRADLLDLSQLILAVQP